jgi:dienelactone hydrolase
MSVVDVREQGLVGSLFAGDDERPRAGVLVLGGSEGGFPSDVAGLLAAEGFICLALAYFGAVGVPRRLVEIPLEYVDTAFAWLREHPLVMNSRLGVLGISKGAELALLAAASFPDAVGAVVAYSPSSVVFPGIGVAGGGSRRSSWSHRNEPVPFVPYPPAVRPSLSLRGFSVVPIYRTALDNVDAVAVAAIPIERSRAPILLISGDEDRMWPAAQMAEMLKARLTDVGRGDQVIHLRYPRAGHGLAPWMPTVGSRLGSLLYDLGGHRSGNRAAVRDAWGKAVSFLRDNLN